MVQSQQEMLRRSEVMKCLNKAPARHNSSYTVYSPSTLANLIRKYILNLTLKQNLTLNINTWENFCVKKGCV